MAYNEVIGQTLQLDLVSSRLVRSFLMLHEFARPRVVTYDVYIGNIDFNGNYMTDNTLCYSGGPEGLANCKGQGQYLIWRLKSGTTSNWDVVFSELKVYDMTDLAQTGTAIASGLTMDEANMSNTLVGTSDSQTECLSADVTTD